MIIELGNYNSAEELLIGTRTTGSRYPYAIERDQSAFVTRAAVRIGGGRKRDANRAQGCIQMGSESGMA